MQWIQAYFQTMEISVEADIEYVQTLVLKLAQVAFKKN